MEQVEEPEAHPREEDEPSVRGRSWRGPPSPVPGPVQRESSPVRHGEGPAHAPPPPAAEPRGVGVHPAPSGTGGPGAAVPAGVEVQSCSFPPPGVLCPDTQELRQGHPRRLPP